MPADEYVVYSASRKLRRMGRRTRLRLRRGDWPKRFLFWRWGLLLGEWRGWLGGGDEWGVDSRLHERWSCECWSCLGWLLSPKSVSYDEAIGPMKCNCWEIAFDVYLLLSTSLNYV